MANIHKLDNFNIKNLIAGNGIVLDTENDLMSDCDEEYNYVSSVPMTPNEIDVALNTDNFDTEYNLDDESLIIGRGEGFGELREKMEDIANGKVFKLILKPGSGEVVPRKSRVVIKYRGYFEYNDEPFDSSACHNSDCTSVRLDNGELLVGLDIGLHTMKKHETAVFLIHPDYAYGEMGCMPRIPPKAEVLFHVILVDFLDDSQLLTYDSLSNIEKQTFSVVESKVESLLLSAKDYYKKNNVKQAIRDYLRAQNWLEKVRLNDDDEERRMKKLLSRVFSNLAVCYLKQNKPRQAIRSCHMIYDEYHSAKTQYSMGKALGQLGEYNKAIEHLKKSLEMSPTREAREEIANVNAQKIKYQECQKKLWSSCLNLVNKKEDSQFEKAVDEICEKFLKDEKLCRYALPDGLTKNEEKCFRKKAAIHGLAVMEQKRYGKYTVYLTKSNFH